MRAFSSKLSGPRNVQPELREAQSLHSRDGLHAVQAVYERPLATKQSCLEGVHPSTLRQSHSSTPLIIFTMGMSCSSRQGFPR